MNPFPIVTRKDLLNPERYTNLECPVSSWDGVINPRSNPAPVRQIGCHENEYLALEEFALESPNIIDIGANIGQSVVAFKSILPSSCVTSFEPNPFAYRSLCRTVSGYAECKAFNYGIGPEEMSLGLWVPVISGHLITPLGSLIKENLHASPMREYIEEMAQGSPIELFKMDAHIKPLPDNLRKPDVIKIDAEGCEIDILKSALSTISSRPIFIIEKSDYKGIIRLLGESGYQAYGYSKFSGLFRLEILESTDENMMPTNIIGVPNDGESLRFTLPPKTERMIEHHLAPALPADEEHARSSPQVGIVGYFKYGNFGDELFQKIWTCAFSKHAVHPVTYGPFEKVDAGTAGVVVGGGDLLSLGESAIESYFSCASIGIPYILSSLGIPFWQAIQHERQSDILLRSFYTDIFANPDCLGISLRDLASYKAAISAYPELSHKISYTPDISFSLFDERLFLRRSKRISPSNHNILACRAEQPIEYNKILAFIIDYSISCGKTVEIFVQGSGIEGERDVEAAMQVIDMAESPPSEIGLHISQSVESTFDYFSSINGQLFSSKYHLCIAALMANLPCYAISCSTKFNELYSDLGIREFLIDVHDTPTIAHAIHGERSLPNIGKPLAWNKRMADLEIERVTSSILSSTGTKKRPYLSASAQKRLHDLKKLAAPGG